MTTLCNLCSCAATAMIAAVLTFCGSTSLLSRAGVLSSNSLSNRPGRSCLCSCHQRSGFFLCRLSSLSLDGFDLFLRCRVITFSLSLSELPGEACSTIQLQFEMCIYHSSREGGGSTPARALIGDNLAAAAALEGVTFPVYRGR